MVQGVMRLEAITYRGRLAACATADRFFLCGELLRRPPGDPERTFVVFMCAYAGDVLRGELPGPYSDERARRYARAALIPAEVLERDQLDPRRAAWGLGVPVEELVEARQELRRGPWERRT